MGTEISVSQNLYKSKLLYQKVKVSNMSCFSSPQVVPLLSLLVFRRDQEAHFGKSTLGGPRRMWRFFCTTQNQIEWQVVFFIFWFLKFVFFLKCWIFAASFKEINEGVAEKLVAENCVPSFEKLLGWIDQIDKENDLKLQVSMPLWDSISRN